jgi:hypothetical protein
MATINDNNEYDESTWEYLRDLLLSVAEDVKPSSKFYYKALATTVRRHFTKPLEDFDTSAVERIGRKVVGRRAYTYYNIVDGDVLDLMLVDNHGDCYDLEEAASPHIVLSQSEIRTLAEEAISLEFTRPSSNRQDQEAEEDFGLRIAGSWEDVLGVPLS